MGKLFGLCRLWHLAYFSRPAKDRPLYRAIRRGRVSRILELGIGDGVRSGRLIEIARRTHTAGPLYYTGVDLFESSSAGQGRLTLKAAHCRLKPTGARLRFVPGEVFTALACAANDIGPCDLIVISADQEQGDSLTKAWFYVPRLLHPATQIFLERPAEGSTPARFEQLGHNEIRRRALAAVRRKAA